MAIKMVYWSRIAYLVSVLLFVLTVLIQEFRDQYNPILSRCKADRERPTKGVRLLLVFYNRINRKSTNRR